MSSLRQPWGRPEGLGQRASHSGAGGVKQNTSPNRSSKGRHLGGSGLRGPWAPWESSVEVILVVGEGLPCGGVRGTAGPSPGGRVSPG